MPPLPPLLRPPNPETVAMIRPLLVLPLLLAAGSLFAGAAPQWLLDASRRTVPQQPAGAGLLEVDHLTHNVYAEGGGVASRPWSLELLPLLIEPAEWAAIDDGVRQRAAEEMQHTARLARALGKRTSKPVGVLKLFFGGGIGGEKVALLHVAHKSVSAHAVKISDIFAVFHGQRPSKSISGRALPCAMQEKHECRLSCKVWQAAYEVHNQEGWAVKVGRAPDSNRIEL